jgi:glutathione S-transferase
MSDITLYFFPGACSHVTMTALEEIGFDYDAMMVNLMAGQQKSPEMLAINPHGKVPALRIGDQVLTENAAILYYLNQQYPAAKLLPKVDSLGLNAGLQDLVWCSSTLHPATRQIKMPMRFTSEGTEGVKANGITTMSGLLNGIAARLETSPWWYGDSWSIVDVYIFWNYTTAQSGGLDLSPWPAVIAHQERVRGIPAFQRAIAREATVMERLSAALAVAKH